MTDRGAYIDTSCFLKLLFPEPESAAVADIVVKEEVIVVSGLTRVEAEQQIVARHLGGHITAARRRKIQTGLVSLLDKSPFESRLSGSGLWDLALTQMTKSKVHCRTLDRLHLAVMAEMGTHRLITHDRRQAAAAIDAGFEVITP